MSRYRQTMSEALKKVYEVDNDYLKSKMTPQQIANIKKTWQNKKASDVTPAIRKMVKDMDIPTQMAIKQANIPHISKLVEEDDHEISMARGELEAISDKALKLSSMLQGKSDETDGLEAWVQSKITKAKDYINSVVDYMTYNPDMANEHMIEAFTDQQIAKLRKEYEPLRGSRISVTNANKLGAMFSKFDSNKNALEKLYGGNIPFISAMAMSRLISKHGYKADQIKKIKVAEEVEFLDEGTGTIKGFRNDKEKSNMVSLAKQHGLKVKDVAGGIELSGNMRKILDMQLAAQGNGLKAEEYVEEGRMSQIDQMRKSGASAADIAKELKLDVKTVKAILGEEIEEEKEVKKGYHKMPDGTIMKDTEHKKEEEEPKDEPKEDDKEKLKAELEKKDDEIAMLKTKAETEKAKVMKKETEKLVNPETGEPLLQIGVAYKHLKDKMAKESLDEMAKDKAYAIGMATAKKKYNDEPPLDKKTIKKGHEIADKLMGMKKEETIKEFKKMVVTIADPIKRDKAMKDMKKYGSGNQIMPDFKIQRLGSRSFRVDGQGADLNKYATDLKNFYGATVKAEENAPTLTDLERLKKQGLKPKKEETQHDLAKMKYEQIAGLKKKAEKSGMPYSILKKVYDRGMAAWRGGHRPGASQQQWAFARVNSFVTKSSGTWGGADKDLAAKVRGSK